MTQPPKDDKALEALKGRPIALFGGSFDPFHNAHRMLAESAVRSLPVDRLIVMPLGWAPHKSTRMRPAAFRYEMASRGVADIPGALVSDEEIKTPDISYTIDTVTHLHRSIAPKDLFLVIGSDSFTALPTWHRYPDLAKSVIFSVTRRGEDDLEELRALAERYRREDGARVVFFPMDASPLSSSHLRSLLTEGKGVEGACPEGVIDAIRTYRIYDFQKEYDALSDAGYQRVRQIERATWPFYKQKQRLHAASVAQYAARLALANGVDPEKAFVTGFVHDAAKNLPEKEQSRMANAYLSHHPDRLQFTSLNHELLHGPAGAFLAREAFGVEAPDVLDAVCFHTVARPHMTPLESVVFLADKIGFDRPFQRLGPIRDLALRGELDRAMALCLDEIFEALRRDGETPHPLSVKARRALP